MATECDAARPRHYDLTMSRRTRRSTSLAAFFQAPQQDAKLKAWSPCQDAEAQAVELCQDAAQQAPRRCQDAEEQAVAPEQCQDVKELTPQQCQDEEEMTPQQCQDEEEMTPQQCQDGEKTAPRPCQDAEEQTVTPPQCQDAEELTPLLGQDAEEQTLTPQQCQDAEELTPQECHQITPHCGVDVSRPSLQELIDDSHVGEEKVDTESHEEETVVAVAVAVAADDHKVSGVGGAGVAATGGRTLAMVMKQPEQPGGRKMMGMMRRYVKALNHMIKAKRASKKNVVPLLLN